MKKLALLALVLAPSAFASVTYDCYPNRTSNGVHESVVIAGSRVHVTSTDRMEGLNFQAAYDSKYVPRTGDNVRFTGSEKGNSRDVILTRAMLTGGMKMRNGKRGGFMQIRGSEDGYWSYEYTCFLR